MSVRQPKPESAARILSRELAKRGIELQHTHALELLAKVLGHNNAHVMRAKTRGHKRKSKEEASVRRDVLDFLDIVALGNTDPDPLAQTASALLKRIQEGLQADCPIIRVGDPPLSASVLKELEAKDDIRAIVEIEGSELLDENFNLEAFLDHVSERITGSLCGLSDITYKVVHLPNPTPEMVAFEVRAAELNWETIEDDELAKQSPSSLGMKAQTAEKIETGFPGLDHYLHAFQTSRSPKVAQQLKLVVEGLLQSKLITQTQAEQYLKDAEPVLEAFAKTPEGQPDPKLPFYGCRLPKTLLFVEFVSSDTRALDGSDRRQVLWFDDGLLGWLEEGMPEDGNGDIADSVIEFVNVDAPSKSEWLHCRDLVEATLSRDGRFELKDGRELYLIDGTGKRWFPRDRVLCSDSEG